MGWEGGIEAKVEKDPETRAAAMNDGSGTDTDKDSVQSCPSVSRANEETTWRLNFR